jgi:hypothetical protein
VGRGAQIDEKEDDNMATKDAVSEYNWLWSESQSMDNPQLTCFFCSIELLVCRGYGNWQDGFPILVSSFVARLVVVVTPSGYGTLRYGLYL